MQGVPQQAGMAAGGDQGGANMENMQSEYMGQCYNVICCPFAVLGGGPQMITVQQGSVGVVTSFGRFNRILPPGRHRFNIMAETVLPVSLKVTCLDVPPQEVMTADNLTIKIDAVTYYKVFDAQKATFAVESYKHSLANLAQVTLRTVLGEHTLAEQFKSREKINARLKELIDEASDPWGIQVNRVEIKSIEIDPSMQRAMAAKAEAGAEAEAKIIQAKAQRDASSILADAAGQMESQPAALKLQYMETLRIISTQGRNSVVIVPEMMDTTQALAAKSAAGANRQR